MSSEKSRYQEHNVCMKLPFDGDDLSLHLHHYHYFSNYANASRNRDIYILVANYLQVNLALPLCMDIRTAIFR